MNPGTELIHKYFPQLTEDQVKQFDMLGELYADWNARINVISRKDIEHLYERHTLHSLGIAKVISFRKGTRILDIGTGGGFPGIPLAILFPECTFDLVDSIGKKIKVVDGVAAALGLKNIKAIWKRAEELERKNQYHFVVSRAVTDLDEFLKWLKGKFAKDNFNDLKNGVLYLRGEGEGSFQTYELKNYFSEEFFETKKVVYVPADSISL